HCPNFAVANIFSLLIFAYPNMMVFVPRKPPTDLQCKSGFFISLVARSTNMCSTSALSTYQFITLVPGNWVRVMLRGRAPNVLSYSCFSCWFFSLLSNIHIPIKVNGPQSTGNDTGNNSKWVCSISGFRISMAFIWYTHDAMLISIMAWTSLSMVIFLHRHHQRMQHILTRHQNHRGHSETRAAHTILML
ncbi:vomeronasal type-1 receptor 4-like, partial [Sigmodon hispidus]